MKLVFIVDQRNSYRLLSTVIAQALKRQHEVVILHLLWTIKSVPIESSPFFGSESKNLSFKEIAYEIDLISYIEKSEYIDFFLSISPIFFQLTEIAKTKVTDRWCIIQHGFDSFGEVWHWKRMGTKGQLHQNYNRLFFIHTSFFYNKGLDFLKKFEEIDNKENYLFFESSKTKIIPVGCLIYSGEPKISNNKAIRIKYNIPVNKHIVIYLPFPFLPARAKYSKKGSYAWQAAFSGMFIDYEVKGETRLLKLKNISLFFLKKIIYLTKILRNFEAFSWFVRNWNEPSVLKEVKRFCDNNDLILVGKSRKKFPHIQQVNKSCYSILEDDSQIYPSLLQELFSIADLVIGFQSTTVLESLLNNTPYLNIELPNSSLNNDEARLFWHTSNEGEMYKYKGAVNSMKIPELIANLHKMNISDFNFHPKQKNEYFKKYLGNEGSESSYNLIKYLEENKKRFI